MLLSDFSYVYVAPLKCTINYCDIVLTVCVFPHDFINHDNIRNLSGCTVVQGHLKILDSAFEGFVCLMQENI